MSNIPDVPEKNAPDAILPEPIGEDGFVQSGDTGDTGDQAQTPGDMEPDDKTGRQYPKTDGNPNVTGDVRSS